jgi:hypothetical protein
MVTIIGDALLPWLTDKSGIGRRVAQQRAIDEPDGHFALSRLNLNVFWWICSVVRSPPVATSHVESRTVLRVRLEYVRI